MQAQDKGPTKESWSTHQRARGLHLGLGVEPPLCPGPPECRRPEVLRRREMQQRPDFLAVAVAQLVQVEVLVHVEEQLPAVRVEHLHERRAASGRKGCECSHGQWARQGTTAGEMSRVFADCRGRTSFSKVSISQSAQSFWTYAAWREPANVQKFRVEFERSMQI